MPVDSVVTWCVSRSAGGVPRLHVCVERLHDVRGRRGRQRVLLRLGVVQQHRTVVGILQKLVRSARVIDARGGQLHV